MNFRNALPALLTCAGLLQKFYEAGIATIPGKDVNALPHGNLIGFPLERRADGEKWCGLLREAREALSALAAGVGE